MKKFTPPIRYTDRDFQSIKESLINYAKKYYPTTATDFNEASFGALMVDMVSYIGDVLSFYLDYQVSESFLDSAIEFRNVLRLAQQAGYKYDPEVTAYGSVAVFIKVPANTSGLGPDTRYFPVLERNARFSTTNGNIPFLLTENIDFQNAQTQTVVSDVDGETGNPLYYAVKTYAPVISGDIGVYTFSVGEYTPFKKIELDVPNVAEILSVQDSEGNNYYEVDYLAQDVVYKAVENREAGNNLVQNIVKAVSVPRRFVVVQEQEALFLQFGEGANTNKIIENDKKLDPSNVALKMHAKDYITTTSFDPYILTANNNLGVGPSNTTVTVTYRTNLINAINVGAEDLKGVTVAFFRFQNENSLSPSEVLKVQESLEISNEDIIVGADSLPTSDEVKIRAKAAIATQSRAVTKQDYISFSYSMPSRFGSIKRAMIKQDKDSFKRNLNLYVVGEGLDGVLATVPYKVKLNLKNWLGRYKMLNDTVDILDAKILNLRIDYIAIGETGFDKYDAQLNVAEAMAKFYSEKPEIGEPIYITDVYNVMNETRGIADISDVTITVQSGGIYSQYTLNLEKHTSPDGRFITLPDDVIYEIRFVGDDIQGVVL